MASEHCPCGGDYYEATPCCHGHAHHPKHDALPITCDVCEERVDLDELVLICGSCGEPAPAYRLYSTAELAAMPAMARFEDRKGFIWAPRSFSAGWCVQRAVPGIAYDAGGKSNSQLARLRLRRVA